MMQLRRRLKLNDRSTRLGRRRRVNVVRAAVVPRLAIAK
jgi:hypothetical protein